MDSLAEVPRKSTKRLGGTATHSLSISHTYRFPTYHLSFDSLLLMHFGALSRGELDRRNNPSYHVISLPASLRRGEGIGRNSG